MSGWEIKGLFYQCTARTNEEYKAELKKRQRLMIILLLLGVLTLVIMAVLIITKSDTLESYTAGFFCGVGTGLILGGLLGVRKIQKTMKDETALKEARLIETDEREQSISAKAIHTTLKIMLLSIYLLLFLCSFITVEAVTVLFLLAAIFFLSYIISRKVYSQRM